MRRYGPDVPLLHIYGQPAYHAPAMICGNRLALIALRDALSQAIEHGTGAAQLFASDGEGYEVKIGRVSTMKALGRPQYTYGTASK
ncbi:MAG: hypothetical protein ACTHOR_01780 [Devosia sp.]